LGSALIARVEFRDPVLSYTGEQMPTPASASLTGQNRQHDAVKAEESKSRVTGWYFQQMNQRIAAPL
jgi:hypothetical protein